MPSRLEHLASRFWDGAGHPSGFPRDLAGVISLSVPLTVVRLAHLSSDAVTAWLSQRGARESSLPPHRRLRAALLLPRTTGFIFVDGDDPRDEQRFSLAHELAHFLLHYRESRERAIRRLGPSIRPVLDGERAPTWDERAEAGLLGVPLRPTVHLFERDDAGRILSAAVSRAEYEADLLALELLAPERAVRSAWSGDRLGLTDLLCREFGLPLSAAIPYARLLAPRPRPHGALADLLRR